VWWDCQYAQKERFIVEFAIENYGKNFRMNIWQSYKQEGGCLMCFVSLATTLLKDEEFTNLCVPCSSMVKNSCSCCELLLH